MTQFICTQLSTVERERTYDQHGQGTLALLSRLLLLKTLFFKVLKVTVDRSV
jgi:hypothetical protein